MTLGIPMTLESPKCDEKHDLTIGNSAFSWDLWGYFLGLPKHPPFYVKPDELGAYPLT
jgi:hypothetical protein